MNGEIVRQETKGKMFFSIYMDTLYLCFSVYIYIYIQFIYGLAVVVTSDVT